MELLHHGVPTLFIPSERQVDDQEARCRWAAEAGAALWLSETAMSGLKAGIQKLLQPDVKTSLQEKAQALVPESGAGEAARLLLELADRGRRLP